jgi:DNA-binding transcriptional LysR family regulator
MPRGDCTGPWGAGPGWGRGRGYGARRMYGGYPWEDAYEAYAGDHGHLRSFPEPPPPGWRWGFWAAPPKEEELAWLQRHAEWLQERLEAIHSRIRELSPDQEKADA